MFPLADRIDAVIGGGCGILPKEIINLCAEYVKLPNHLRAQVYTIPRQLAIDLYTKVTGKPQNEQSTSSFLDHTILDNIWYKIDMRPYFCLVQQHLSGLKRGDLIRFEFFEDKGLSIFNGYQIELLALGRSCGAVPKEFQVVADFPIRYWQSHLVSPNNHVALNFKESLPEIKEEDLVDNIELDNRLTGTRPIWYTSFRYDEEYFIVGLSDDNIIQSPKRRNKFKRAIGYFFRAGTFLKFRSADFMTRTCLPQFENNILFLEIDRH